jgi:hypothetical protein
VYDPNRDLAEKFLLILETFEVIRVLLDYGAKLALVVAEAKAQEASVQVRVYDQGHHDYHNWDNREDRAYRHYLVVEHRNYRECHRQHHNVQKHYWNWRHAHLDWD